MDVEFCQRFSLQEKEMETHSSVLAWRIPGMGEPGGLSSMGLQTGQLIFDKNAKAIQ